MALEHCCKCGGGFLTEADPYLVYPAPNGYHTLCARCVYAATKSEIVEAVKVCCRHETESFRRKVLWMYLKR